MQYQVFNEIVFKHLRYPDFPDRPNEMFVTGRVMFEFGYGIYFSPTSEDSIGEIINEVLNLKDTYGSKSASYVLVGLTSHASQFVSLNVDFCKTFVREFMGCSLLGGNLNFRQEDHLSGSYYSIDFQGKYELNLFKPSDHRIYKPLYDYCNRRNSEGSRV